MRVTSPVLENGGTDIKKKGRKRRRLGLKEVKSKTLLVNLMQNLREREATFRT